MSDAAFDFLHIFVPECHRVSEREIQLPQEVGPLLLDVFGVALEHSVLECAVTELEDVFQLKILDVV